MQTREEGIKVVTKGLILLGCITIAEVLFALLGNGHIVEGLHFPKFIMVPVMVAASLYKAWFIIFEFMHMRYEVKGLAMSVLLPTLLLVWGIIAFMQEGGRWRQRRNDIIEKNKAPLEEQTVKPQGFNLEHRADTKRL